MPCLCTGAVQVSKNFAVTVQLITLPVLYCAPRFICLKRHLMAQNWYQMKELCRGGWLALWAN